MCTEFNVCAAQIHTRTPAPPHDDNVHEHTVLQYTEVSVVVSCTSCMKIICKQRTHTFVNLCVPCVCVCVFVPVIVYLFASQMSAEIMYTHKHRARQRCFERARSVSMSCIYYDYILRTVEVLLASKPNVVRRLSACLPACLSMMVRFYG